MSGRKGLDVKVDEIMNLVDKELEDSYGKYSALVDVRNGVLKFEMLKQNAYQDMTFDVNSALDIKGFTGSYVQYTYARCKSVLMTDEGVYDMNTYFYNSLKNKDNLDDLERDLLKYLYRLPEVITESADKYSPNLLCQYLYELCQKYNSFYNTLPIIKSSGFEKSFRINLTAATASVVKTGLYLLGINAPERM